MCGSSRRKPTGAAAASACGCLLDAQTGALVGRAGLQYTDVEGADEVELLYALRPESWGRGLATEVGERLLGIAFSVLELPSVVAYTLPENVRSRRVLDKLGFAYEREFDHEGHPHVLYRLTGDGPRGPDGARAAHAAARRGPGGRPPLKGTFARPRRGMAYDAA